MADKRPWAKIDTGYMLNPKWFQVERELRDSMANPMANDMANRMASAIRVARESHLASILYCAQNSTDGFFPVRAIKAISAVHGDDDEAAISALFTVGLWVNHPGGMAEVRDFLEHQTPAALSTKRSKAGKKGAEARWQNDGKSHDVANGKTMARANAEEKRREESNSLSEVADATPRPDMIEILDYLDEAIRGLDAKVPGRTKANLTAARLLIDKDGHTVEQIKRAIDYATTSYWSGNVLSMHKLRQKYDQLRLNAQRDAQRASKPAYQQAPGRVLIPEVGTPEWEERYGSH